MVGKHFLVYNKAVHITNQSIRSMSLEGSLGGNFTSDYKPYSFWIHDHVFIEVKLGLCSFTMISIMFIWKWKKKQREINKLSEQWSLSLTNWYYSSNYNYLVMQRHCLWYPGVYYMHRCRHNAWLIQEVNAVYIPLWARWRRHSPAKGRTELTGNTVSQPFN